MEDARSCAPGLCSTVVDTSFPSGAPGRGLLRALAMPAGGLLLNLEERTLTLEDRALSSPLMAFRRLRRLTSCLLLYTAAAVAIDPAKVRVSVFVPEPICNRMKPRNRSKHSLS